MRPSSIATIAGTIATILASPAHACSFSNVNPGQSTTTSVVRLAVGKACNVSMDLEGWEIHRITVVERPRSGGIEVRGTRGYIYRTGKARGADKFVMEFETTGVDWFPGARQQRTIWRLTVPVEIQ
jgi:hypothetical protein